MAKFIALKYLLLSMLLILLGLVAIGLIPWFPPPSHVIQDLGIALLTAGTVGLVVDRYTRRDVQELLVQAWREGIEASTLPQRLDLVLNSMQSGVTQVLGSIRLGEGVRAVGIRRIHRERGGVDLHRLLQEAAEDSDIRMLGVALIDFLPAVIHQEMQNKLARGCRIRVLLLDSASRFVAQRAMEENRDPREVRDDIEGALRIHRSFLTSVPEPARSRIEVRCYDAPPQHLILDTSSSMVVGFYLRGARGNFFPHLELDTRTTGGIHEVFRRHFELLWEASKEASVSSVTAPESSCPKAP